VSSAKTTKPIEMPFGWLIHGRGGGAENAGHENTAQKCSGGKCGEKFV